MYEFVYIIVFFYLNGATPFENKLRYNYATSDLYVRICDKNTTKR